MTKNLTAEEISLNVVSLLQQSTDPTAGGGTAAAIGSLLLRNGPVGQAWLKTGVADTAWQQLVQSLAWLSVLDFGATGNGVTDDTAAIQAAINAAAAAGGGVVYFPPGTYVVSQLTMTGAVNVQLQGAGMGSVIKWVFNAAGAPGSMLTISSGATNTRLNLLRLDGSGLTNPDAARTNHMVSVVGAVTTLHVSQIQIGAMVATSGDGIHVVGTLGSLVSRLWIVDNHFDGCSRFGVGVEQGADSVFVTNNVLTNNGTDIAVVATANLNTNAIGIHNNTILHTGAVRHAIRLEGDPVGLITRLTMGGNKIVGGMATFSGILWAAVENNICTSGAFASTDAVWRVFGNVSFSIFASGNLVDRDPGASAGPVITVEKATVSPSMVRVGANILINEKSGDFIKIVDATRVSVGGNNCRSTDAGASVAFGIDVQAVTVALTDMLIGPGNQMTTAANSLAAGVRLLANGANVSDASVVGNQGDQMDFGVRFEIGGGGGVFSGQIMYNGNNFDSTVGNINNVGVTVRPRIGLNASTFGANYFEGAGSPEGVITARVSSIYSRTDGGQGTSIYYKESGAGNTGWVALGGAPIPFGADTLTSVATPVFLAPGYIATASATEIKMTMTRPGTIRNLGVQVAVAGVDIVPTTVTFTVRKNGVDTTLTTSIANIATGAASDTTHSVAVVAGDLISISATKNNAVTTGQSGVTATLELI